MSRSIVSAKGGDAKGTRNLLFAIWIRIGFQTRGAPEGLA